MARSQVDKWRNTTARVIARAVGRMLVAERLLVQLGYYNHAAELRRVIRSVEYELVHTPSRDISP
jgi:hypothetical protein